MTPGGIRSLLAAIAVAAVLLYGLVGHGLPQLSSHDGMAGAAAGLCLLLAIVLGHVAAPKPEAHETAIATQGPPAPVGSLQLAPMDGRARASPSALQRFRN